MATHSTLGDWLKSIPVHTVIPERGLVSVDASANLSEALKKLNEVGVHCLPVKEGPKIIGHIDVLDIVCSIFDAGQLESYARKGHFEPADVAEALMSTEKLDRHLAEVTVKDMMARSERTMEEIAMGQATRPDGPVVHGTTIGPDGTLLEALEILGLDGRHRVPVVDNGEVLDILAQSDVVRFLLKNAAVLPKDIMNTPLAANMTKHVVKVSVKASMIEALAMFKKHKVMALAVVDAAGHFITPLSALDFVARANDHTVFALTVGEFFEGHASAPAVVAPSMTLVEAMTTVAEGKLHRLWVGHVPEATPDKKHIGPPMPVLEGVVSLRDLIIVVAHGRTTPFV